MGEAVGNNPDVKLLLLHGGPGATHEYFEACDSFLPNAGIEYYYYDQLGSGRSDVPEDSSLYDDQQTYFTGLISFLNGLR